MGKVLVCRCEHPLPPSERAKIALFCNVPASAVIPALDAKSIALLGIAPGDSFLAAAR